MYVHRTVRVHVKVVRGIELYFLYRYTLHNLGIVSIYTIVWISINTYKHTS